MNPNRAEEDMDCFIKSGTLISDLNLDEVSSKKKYIGVKNKSGKIVGAIQSERIKYLIDIYSKFSFNFILDKVDRGVVAIDKESRIFYVNEAYGRILNIQPGKIIGRLLEEIEGDAELLNVLRSKKAKKKNNQLIKSINKYVNTEMFPIFVKGKLFGACSIFSDVTEINNLNVELDKAQLVVEEYRKEIELGTGFIGDSKVYRECIEKASMVANTDAAVLLRGENGTGKEVISKFIQEHSRRSKEPFIKVNCAAIPEGLMESELFGYEEGSFTGSKKGGNIGKFELANNGTIFLDEIGDISLSMQAKLLRVLQENEITRVGGNETIPINVRVISATNQDLERLISDKKFRMDLYFRLNVIELFVPPLRERGRDIVLLANRFLQEYNERYNQNKVLDSEVYKSLLGHSWPGNVRELRNTIESAAILTSGDLITNENILAVVKTFNQGVSNSGIQNTDNIQHTTVAAKQYFRTLKEEVEEFEITIIKGVLQECGWNRRKAAEKLGITERTLYRKLSEYSIK